MDNITIKTILEIVLLSVASLVMLSTILPLFNYSYWVFRIGDFPRLQIAVLCLFSIIILPIVFGVSYWIIAIEFILTFCFSYQLSRIFPYTRFHSKQVQRNIDSEPKSSIKLLISNVLIENRNAKKLLHLIEKNDPDVILLAEIDDWWDEAVMEIKNDYPINLCKPLDNAYGMNFYTRLKSENVNLNFIVEDDIPSIEADIFLRSGDKIKFYGLHPRPPFPTESKKSAKRDAELLIVGKKIQESDLPTIIAGDFNDVAWSKTTNLFQKISGLLDSRIGRGFYNSFHAKFWFMRMPLDHVFQSNHFRLVKIERLESIESDHFPILIELSLESNAEIKQDELESNDKDEKERQKKVIEGVEK